MRKVKICAAGMAVLALAAAGPAEEGRRLVSRLDEGKPQTVVAYGTSLTAGGEWGRHLQQALDAQYPGLAKVINSGQNGMWSTWGVDNLESRVISHKPDTVFIEFAINDSCLDYRTSVEEARSNLTNMIHRILSSNPDTEIILMTMNPPVGRHYIRRPRIGAYYQMYRDVANERKLRLIDHARNWERLLETNRALFDQYVPDGLHPGPEGSRRVIAPEIFKALGIGAELHAD